MSDSTSFTRGRSAASGGRESETGPLAGLRLSLAALFVMVALLPVAEAQQAPKVAALRTGEQAGHYLEKGGRPLLLIGDNVTQGWMELGTDFDQAAYVDALASRGMNLLMLWSFMATDAAGQENDSRIGYDAPEIWPWAGSPDHANFDLADLNQAYFDRLKQLVAYAESKGVVVLVTVHDGWTKGRFDEHPFNSALGNGPLADRYQYVELADYDREMPTAFDPSWSRQQKNQYLQERFCDKLIAELNSYSNVVYEMFNEGKWYDANLRNRHEQHFLTFFRARCDNLLLSNSDEILEDDPHVDPKVDLVTYHGGWTDRFNDFQNGFGRSSAKAYLLSEPVPGWDGSNVSLDDIRRSMWEVTMAGAGWVNQNDTSFAWDPLAGAATLAPLRDQSYDYAGHCSRFFNRSGVTFWNMRPQGSLSSTGICLAHEGVEYAVYAPSGGTISLDLSAGAGQTFSVRWYNPRTGEFLDDYPVQGGTTSDFTSPDSSDWVLHLVAAGTAPTNQAPVAFSGAATTTEAVAVSGTLNACDPDGDVLTYTLVTGGSRGTARITEASTGAYTYTPGTGVTGTDTFTFKANDGQADSNVATVTVTINPAPTPPSTPTLAALRLDTHNYAYPGEGWDNAVDGDTQGWDGTVTAKDSPPFAIFAFADGSTKLVSRLRVMTDTGVSYQSRWVTRFTVQVSTTDTSAASFTTVLNRVSKSGGGWQEYSIPSANARYIKLILDQPDYGWRQLGEFEVYAGN
jgi:hypothetical protein